MNMVFLWEDSQTSQAMCNLIAGHDKVLENSEGHELVRE